MNGDKNLKITPEINNGDKNKKSKNMKIFLISVIILFLVGAALVVVRLLFKNDDTGSNNQNINITNTNVNSLVNENLNINDETNINPAAEIISDQEVIITGKVFIKGYDTPSESYGITSLNGTEIGLGKYDSMKEQFRQYIGENVAVIFEKICRSTASDCCKTLFYYCGTVKSWEPVQ